MSNVTRVLAAVVLAAFSVGPVSAATVSNAPATVAQNATIAAGSVSGSVTDETGAAVSGATISVRGAATYTATTDAAGAFTIANINPGLYSLEVQKPGYDMAVESDFAVAAGVAQQVAIRVHTSTLTSLRTIATVRSTGRGTFNTTSAAVNAINPQVFKDQAQPQVTRVLNEIPGTQISLPQTSANGAVPGAITFPNIRGALSFETASLIDGHPVSVGTFGDYVTTFLNSYMLGTTEVIKGPGAMAPQVNYAIGGTINFRTKDPTAAMTPDYTIGFTNHGGTYTNFGISGTESRLGFVADIATIDDPSALNRYPAIFDPAQNAVVTIGGTPTVLSGNNSFNLVPGTASTIKNSYSLFACCYSLSGQYNSTAELLKLRYKFSDATTGTVSYLGSQTYADQNGNRSSQTPMTFNPGPGYAGTAYAPGSALRLTSLNPMSTDQEINNEPIFQAELRSTLGNDTVLARYYHASIDRLIHEGASSPNVPTSAIVNLYGTTASGVAFNGPTQVNFYDYFQQTELDALNGISFQYDHPFGQNDLTFSADSTNSTTTSYSISSNAAFGGFNPTASPFVSINLPTGSAQRFTTYLLRGHFQVNPKLSGIVSLYDNSYNSTYPIARAANFGYDGTGYTFASTTNNHFDQRFALEYRPKNNLAIRAAAGSAIAPPYLFLLSTVPSTSYNKGTGLVTNTLNAGGLRPETAWGYDLGADYRMKDGVTYVSGDVYRTNLFNHFLSQITSTGLACPAAGIACGSAPAGTPIVQSQTVNLATARFEGIELAIRRAPLAGVGFNLAGSVNRGYAYNLPPCFYGVPPKSASCGFATNLGVIAGNNFTGGGVGSAPTGFGFGGFSNQNIPYLQGNAEINYHTTNGAYFAFGDTLYGKNNSLNEPPFAIAYLTARYPLSDKLSVQISGDNVFNAYSGLFPTFGSGVAIPLAASVNGLPAQAATTAGVLGPATWRFELTKTFGANP